LFLEKLWFNGLLIACKKALKSRQNANALLTMMLAP